MTIPTARTAAKSSMMSILSRMVKFVRRNSVSIWLTLLTVFAVGGMLVIGIAIAHSSPSERPRVEHSDTKMPEPGPGIGINGKFSLNPFGIAPGL